MSIIIIGSGDGRAALRRFEEAQNPTQPGNSAILFTSAQCQKVNEVIANLTDLADEFGCPEDPCPE